MPETVTPDSYEILFFSLWEFIFVKDNHQEFIFEEEGFFEISKIKTLRKLPAIQYVTVVWASVCCF